MVVCPNKNFEQGQECLRFGVSYAAFGHEERRVFARISHLSPISLRSSALRSKSIRMAISDARLCIPKGRLYFHNQWLCFLSLDPCALLSEAWVR